VSAELSTTGRCPGCLTALVYSSGVVVSLAPEAPVVLASIWHGREYKLFEPGVVDPVAWLDGVVESMIKRKEDMLLRFLVENEQGESSPGTR